MKKIRSNRNNLAFFLLDRWSVYSFLQFNKSGCRKHHSLGKSVVMSAKKENHQPIDWESIPITLIPEGEPNPQNPYALLTEEERMQQLRELCQRIYLRMVEEIDKNEM